MADGGYDAVAAGAAAGNTVFAGTVLAVNELTARWARESAVPGENTVLSAVGVWPLLAFLGGAAEGTARGELAAALGVSPPTAIARGRELLEILGAQDGLAAALGVWTRDEVKPREEWLSRLPPAVTGRLTGEPATDRAALDAWADRGTGGLVPRLPLEVSAETLLVLASALSVRTAWRQPFRPGWMRPESGPWQRRELAGLRRLDTDLDEVAVAATPRGPLTVLAVRGDGGIDVHLLLGGPEQAPGAVIEAGTLALAGAYESVPGSLLPEGDAGPGVKVGYVASPVPEATLAVSTPAFTVGADHDLLARAELFGLVGAADPGQGHFPGISDIPLAVGQARQAVTAAFRAEGFEAAAVTAFALAAGGAAPRERARTVSVDFERPFGFLAVHRTSGLVLAAGWVAEPEQAVLRGGGPPWPAARETQNARDAAAEEDGGW
ncbi:serpin family protein [Actinacidiphila sp. ITFR-21]|uniref:serpin family protein n=1 Tax=Actinacidiphila sp. ITFR-21 TaxID=3075199 RepID=UPI00288951B4|nr:serpin family protein [Streptomyces sp. ITFR-21]WNI18686.1 serpin family protein [Streptomyces sp. ITFR-21]